MVPRLVFSLLCFHHRSWLPSFGRCVVVRPLGGMSLCCDVNACVVVFGWGCMFGCFGAEFLSGKLACSLSPCISEERAVWAMIQHGCLLRRRAKTRFWDGRGQVF